MGAHYGSQLAQQHRAVLNGGSNVPFDTYTTAKSVINPEDRVSLGPNFWKMTRGIWIHIFGALKNTTGNPTFQPLLKLGTIASPVTIWDGGQVQMNATAHTVLPFVLDIYLRPDKDNHGDGTLSKLVAHGVINSQVITRTSGQTDDAQGNQSLILPPTAPALGAGFDDSITNVLDFWVGFSANNALNGVQIWDFSVFDKGLAFPAAQ